MKIRSFTYDLRRTLLSKSVVILMALLILLSLTLIPIISASGRTGGSTNAADTQTFAYYDSSGYHFISFAWNHFGQGLGGVTFVANTVPMNVSSKSLTATGTTNASGITHFDISSPPDPNIGIGLSMSQSNGYTNNWNPYSPFINQVPSTNSTTTWIDPGSVVPIFGSGGINVVTDAANSSKRDIIVNWVGSFGSEPKNYSLYFFAESASQTSGSSSCQPQGQGASCTTGSSSNPLQESSMQFLGTLNSYSHIYQAPVLKSPASNISRIIFVLFNSNGSRANGSLTSFDPSVVYPPPPPPISVAQGNSFVITFFEGIFGIVIPLMVILGSYNSYGKDRVSGVLESVLALPITRKELALSRFTSNFAALSIAILASMGVVDAIVWYLTGSPVSATILLSSACAFLVELSAFTGIMMLASHLVKSQSALVGFGIGLFVAIDFFWGIIVVLISSVLGVASRSVAFTQLLVIGQYLNPSQFVGVVDTLLTHQVNFVGFGSFGFPISPSDYGITSASVISAGIVWSIFPLFAFLYLATKRE